MSYHIKKLKEEIIFKNENNSLFNKKEIKIKSRYRRG